MIVWARVPDRSGVIKPNPRPLVILSVHPNKKGPFVACCVSTQPAADTDEPIFELPWDAQTGSSTGFYKRCAAVIRWQVIVEQTDVDENIPLRELSPELFEQMKRAIDDDKTWR